jgi:hypothetical protein
MQEGSGLTNAFPNIFPNMFRIKKLLKKGLKKDGVRKSSLLDERKMASGRAHCYGQGERKENLRMVTGRINVQGSNDAREKPFL